MSSMAQDSAVVDQLSASSVPTLVFEATTIEGIYQNIRALGQALGREEQAEGLVGEMEGKFDHAREVAADRKGEDVPVVYFEVSPIEYGLWTAGAGTFMQEAADLLGATNAFGDLDGWASVSEEQVIDRAPTIIVTTSTDEDAVREICSRPSWQHVPAVADRRVLAVPNDMFTRPGPRVADATVMLAEYLGEGE
jgi:iron complex transport system substrate-binding protein